MNRCQLASTLLMAACLLIAPTRAAEPLAERRSAEPSPADGPAITLSGFVRTPAGEPVAGATIALRAKTDGGFYSSGLRHDRDVLAIARSGDDGRFEFDAVPIPPRFAEEISHLMLGRVGAQLVAWADGWGLAWTDVRQLRPAKEVQLALALQADVRGILRDEEGKGIPDMAVRIYGLTRATAEYDFVFRAPGDLRLSMSELSLGGRTDVEGRLVIPHLPQGYRALAIADNPGRKREVFMIDTERDNDFRETQAREGGRNVYPVLRTPIELTLPAERFVRVNVMDHRGDPITSGVVELITGNRHYASSVGDGGVARIGFSDSGAYTFRYSSDPLAPAVNLAVTAMISAEKDTRRVEIRLPESRHLTGRVVDASTGAAVAGAHVAWTAGFEAAGSDTPWSMAISDASGEFRLPVVAGTGRLRVDRPVHGYLAPNYPIRQRAASGMLIEVPEIGDAPYVEIRLSRGLVLRGVVRDRGDEPVAGATVLGESLEQPITKAVAISDAQGRYELTGLSPHTEAEITAIHSSGGAQGVVPGAANHSWSEDRVVELDLPLENRVTLSGTMLKGGQPAEGVRLRLFKSVPGKPNQMRVFTELATDADGRYQIDGLRPGDHYHFEIDSVDGLTAVGWKHQSPYVSKVPDNAEGAIQLADALLVGRNQALAGQVVDRQDKPVAGIRVSAQLAGGGYIVSSNRTAPSYTETDEDGRFHLRQLPDEPIELMVYRANPRGGRILYPARVRPAINQRDIRILLDPTLLQELEDLDKQ